MKRKLECGGWPLLPLVRGGLYHLHNDKEVMHQFDTGIIADNTADLVTCLTFGGVRGVDLAKDSRMGGTINGSAKPAKEVTLAGPSLIGFC